jgi:2-polyprenyl-3-methyl-5-hydroxy-6-metoxy-1,4-benzoquinol methylase
VSGSTWMPVRAQGPELMDLPDSDPRRLERTLRQIEWVNRLLTGYRRLLERSVLEDLHRRPGRPPYTLLDVGSGGGDIAAWLASRQAGLRIVCLDHDPRAVAFARRRCAALPTIEVRQGSVSELDSMERFDYVLAHSFLHHLPEGEIAPAVQAMLRRARRLLVASDLLRSRRSHVIFSLFAAVFLHRSFAPADGRLSIRKGFLPEELRGLLSGIEGFERLTIRCEPPGRIVLIGRP